MRIVWKLQWDGCRIIHDGRACVAVMEGEMGRWADLRAGVWTSLLLLS